MTLSWRGLTSRGDGDPLLGIVVLLCLLTATLMLLFAVFDKRQPAQQAQTAYGTPPAPAQGQAHGYSYGQ